MQSNVIKSNLGKMEQVVNVWFALFLSGGVRGRGVIWKEHNVVDDIASRLEYLLRNFVPFCFKRFIVPQV